MLSEHADQGAVGSRHEDGVDAASTHPVEEWIDLLARSDGGDTEAHDVGDDSIRVGLEGCWSTVSMTTPASVITTQPGGGGLPTRVATSTTRSSRPHLTTSRSAMHGQTRVPLVWEVECEPVHLAGGIVGHGRKAETLEPARGSRAHVVGRAKIVRDSNTTAMKPQCRAGTMRPRRREWSGRLPGR